MKIYSVSELNIEAREVILLTFEYPVSVKGEITDLRTARGHQYFKLRDQHGMHTVSCVLWKNSSTEIDISKYLDMEVIISAKVDFYAGFGQFQLNIHEITEFGDGFLKKEIESLKKKLSLEGLFDQHREIPSFPKNIAVLTAPDSHALKDVCSKINERYPLARILVYPSTVQGVKAPSSLTNQLRRINKENKVDVILIVRGGGSLQDLMAFNEEIFVREISKSKIVTITGIGHKPDVTLADYASDSAQETPTAAAVKAVPDINTIRQDIYECESLISKIYQRTLYSLSDKVKNIGRIIKMSSPSKKVESLDRDFKRSESILRQTFIKIYKNHEKELNSKEVYKRRILKIMESRNVSSMKSLGVDIKLIEKAVKNKISQFIDLLGLKAQQLHSSNPTNVLKKGYAIIRDNKDKIIKDAKTAKKNMDLKIQLMDGEIEVYRKETKKT